MRKWYCYTQRDRLQQAFGSQVQIAYRWLLLMKEGRIQPAQEMPDPGFHRLVAIRGNASASNIAM